VHGFGAEHYTPFERGDDPELENFDEEAIWNQALDRVLGPSEYWEALLGLNKAIGPAEFWDGLLDRYTPEQMTRLVAMGPEARWAIKRVFVAAKELIELANVFNDDLREGRRSYATYSPEWAASSALRGQYKQLDDPERDVWNPANLVSDYLLNVRGGLGDATFALVENVGELR
jgi:hypothetical protein